MADGANGGVPLSRGLNREDVIRDIYNVLRECYSPLQCGAMLYAIGVTTAEIDVVMKAAGDV